MEASRKEVLAAAGINLEEVLERLMGSDTLLERLKRLLNLEVGEVTYDGRFSIEQVPCFGTCDVSPAVRVNGVVYGRLDSEERILDMLQQLN